MNDLVEFLRTRLDEDKRVARAATPGPWSYNPEKVWLDGEAFESFDHSKGEEFVGYGGPSPFRGCVAATGPADHPQSMADAAFIACHDPARVLAEVDAKRAFIEDADYVMRSYENDNAPDTYGGVYACEQMLKRLASVYADHPDYRQEWRP